MLDLENKWIGFGMPWGSTQLSERARHFITGSFLATEHVLELRECTTSVTAVGDATSCFFDVLDIKSLKADSRKFRHNVIVPRRTLSHAGPCVAAR